MIALSLILWLMTQGQAACHFINGACWLEQPRSNMCAIYDSQRGGYTNAPCASQGLVPTNEPIDKVISGTPPAPAEHVVEIRTRTEQEKVKLGTTCDGHQFPVDKE